MQTVVVCIRLPIMKKLNYFNKLAYFTISIR